jgi:phage anti-repressor protein
MPNNKRKRTLHDPPVVRQVKECVKSLRNVCGYATKWSKWYPCRIVDVRFKKDSDDLEYQVHYVGWSKNHDQWLVREYIRCDDWESECQEHAAAISEAKGTQKPAAFVKHENPNAHEPAVAVAAAVAVEEVTEDPILANAKPKYRMSVHIDNDLQIGRNVTVTIFLHVLGFAVSKSAILRDMQQQLSLGWQLDGCDSSLPHKTYVKPLKRTDKHTGDRKYTGFKAFKVIQVTDPDIFRIRAQVSVGEERFTYDSAQHNANTTAI